MATAGDDQAEDPPHSGSGTVGHRRVGPIEQKYFRVSNVTQFADIPTYLGAMWDKSGAK